MQKKAKQIAGVHGLNDFKASWVAWKIQKMSSVININAVDD